MGQRSVVLDRGGSPGGSSLRTIYLPVEPSAPAQVRPRVTLVTEGTYPYYWGGVSTWCHSLVHGLDDVEFTVVSIVSDPNREPLFELPPELEVVTVPMWGTRQALEVGTSNGGVLLPGSVRRVQPGVLESGFLPAFRTFLAGLWDDRPDLARFESSIGELHDCFIRYGFDPIMRSPETWEAFRSWSTSAFPSAAVQAGYPGTVLSLSDVDRGLQIVTRWLQPLALRFPETDIVHAAMAGVCTLVAVAIRRDRSAAFFLSEHGIYLREALLAESRSRGSLFLKLLSLGFALRMTELSYLLADQISPCCDDHKRWELRLGADPGRVRTLYYGVDPAVFRPADRPEGRPATVVWVGRIDPLKDVETLLRAAAIVRDARPDVRFRLFGAAPPGNEEYDARCRALHHELGLEETVVFEGFTSSPADAFNQGDVAVLTSISEGFPYSTLEAMLCGRPVVATGVGGLAEQVGDCGVIVEPRNPAEIADALLRVLADGDALRRLGACARERSSQTFSLDGFLESHHEVYRRLAEPVSDRRCIGPRDGSASVVARAVPPPAPLPAGHALAATLADRVPMPVDPLEVTAVLESTGVTPAVARRHGAEDTFALADHVLDELRERGVAHPRAFDPERDTPGRRPVRSRMAALGGVVPAVAATVVLIRSAGTGIAVEPAIFGMLFGLLVSNGLLQGLTPRASLYTGCENWAGLRTAVVRFWVLSGIVVLGASAVAFGLGSAWEVATMSARAAFLVAGCAISLFWVSTGGLFALGRPERSAAAVAAGAAVGSVVWASGAGWIPAVATGYVVALVAVVGDTVGLLRRAGATRQALLGLPGIGTMLRESAPFGVYGALAMVVLLSPHAVVLLHPFGSPVNPRVFQFELAVNLALAPLLATALYADRVVERFWGDATRLEVEAPAVDPAGFSAALAGLVAAGTRRVVGFLCVGTAVFLFSAEVVVAEVGDSLPGVIDRPAFGATLVAASVAHLLIGWALLECGWLSSFGSPGAAAVSAGLGVMAVVATGLVVTGMAVAATPPIETSVLVTVTGAGTFAAGSWLTRRTLMEKVAHRFAIRF